MIPRECHGRRVAPPGVDGDKEVGQIDLIGIDIGEWQYGLVRGVQRKEHNM